jgi:hypothetical protein
MRCTSLFRLVAMVALATPLLIACGGQEGDGECTIGEADPICVGDNCLGAAWSSDLASYGEPCTAGPDCLSGLCALDSVTNANYCTELCEPNGSPCPGDVACFAAGSQHVCGPPALDCPDP